MFVALNNKSNLLLEDFMKYQEDLKKVNPHHSKLVICPCDCFLPLFHLENMDLGAQNVSKYKLGAHTGEIAATQLKSLKPSFCIVGHSERREEQRETNADIKEKITLLFEEEITPILCVGETKQQRDDSKVKEIIEEEIKSVIEGLNEKQKSQLIVAYEPIWSIGTGLIPTLDQIEEVFIIIKNLLPESILLYGGSANEENIELLKTSSLIGGYLLGGLSLKPEKLQLFLDKLEN